MQKLPPEQKLIVEIMALAFAVHENTPFCVFIEWSGHVNQLSVDIRESKEKWQNEVCKTEFYNKFKEYHDKKSPLAYLKSRRDVLREILTTHDIPYQMMERQVEYIYKHNF